MQVVNGGANGGRPPADPAATWAVWWWLIKLTGLGLVLCVVFFGAAVVFLEWTEGDTGDCPERPEEQIGRPGEEPIALEPGDQLLIEMRYSRGAVRDSTSLAASADVQGDVDVTTTALSGPNGSIAADEVVATARGVRSTVLVDICVMDNAVGWNDNGTYSGSVVVTDERLAPLSVPITVTAQSRYVWALAPFVVLVPWVAQIAATSMGLTEAPLGIKAWIAGMGAAGAVYGAQALANASWGGPVAFFGLIASMYVASAGVIATVGPTSTRPPGTARREPPPPPPPEPGDAPASGDDDGDATEVPADPSEAPEPGS